MPAPPVSLLPDPSAAALLEAARRSARGGAGRCVLLLHLSAAAGVQPHHIRVARAILLDVAQRLDGEVLRLANGDPALVCRLRPGLPDPIGPFGEGADGLPAVLQRLFAMAAPRDGRLFSRWQLPRDAAAMQACLAQQKRAAGDAAAIPAAAPDPLRAVPALLDFTGVRALMRRQTTMRIEMAAGVRRLRPCFQEVAVSIDALEHRIAAYGQARADPFVFHHLMARLDSRTLPELTRRIATGEELPPDQAVAVHVNLTLPGILSAAFEALAQACRARGRRLGVELAVVEACSEPARFAAARGRLDALGVLLVLDGVTPEAMAMTRLDRLEAALVKLDWTPALPRLADAEQERLAAALEAIGPERLVLHRAETEAALTWGLARGISMFQGRHVDAMRAAGRIMGCAHAAGCTLRQCMDRAAAMDPGGRAGCRDPALLDGRAQHLVLSG